MHSLRTTWILLTALLLCAATPAQLLATISAPIQIIFADGFETGDLSAWSDALRESCDFPHCWLDPLTPCPPSPPCSFTDKTCFMGELITSPPQDLCIDTPDTDPFPLPEFADCLAAGLLRGVPCGPSSLCVQLAPGDVQCRDLCATSEGAFGTTNHPDCRRPEAVCADALFHPDFGLCE